MQSTMTSKMQMGTKTQSFVSVRPRTSVRTARLVVRPRATEEKPKGEWYDAGMEAQVPVKDNKEVDSFTRLEAPVRGSAPDGGPPVEARLNQLDQLLIQNDAPEEKRFLNNEVAFPDAMRFKGAAPEVINARLAMLGFALALFGEITTGRDIVSQVQNAPTFTVGTFALFIIASLVPILRGQQRKAFGIFSPIAEVNIGRVAMLGFAGLLLNELIRGHAFFA